MVRWLGLALSLSACALREGAVLIALDGGADGAVEEREPDVPSAEEDASEAGLADAAADAEPMTDAADAGSLALGVCRIGGAKDGFYDSFDGSALSAAHWLVAHGPVQFAGQRAQGGFAHGNVSVAGGALVLRVRGDRYTGPVRSVDERGVALASGKRSAAAVATRDLFASGTYQVQGHFAGPTGVELALWFVRDDDSAGALDMALPGESAGEPSYAHVRMRSRDASSTSLKQFALGASLDDGGSHILRFDWYTTASSAVNFWVDDMARWETDQSLPSGRAGRLWIVAWVPDTAPADFDTVELRIENAFVTPFGNAGDRCTDRELAGPFLLEP